MADPQTTTTYARYLAAAGPGARLLLTSVNVELDVDMLYVDLLA